MRDFLKRAFGALQPQDMARQQLHDTRMALLDAEAALENARCHVSLLAERESRLAAFVQGQSDDAQPFRTPVMG
jgi:hypothetical protein